MAQPHRDMGGNVYRHPAGLLRLLLPLPLPWPLGAVSQEVIVMESCSADGWALVEAGVRPMPVVLVIPGQER
jgi:hypothetical protein